jgi:hypothetical protein
LGGLYEQVLGEIIGALKKHNKGYVVGVKDASAYHLGPMEEE